MKKIALVFDFDDTLAPDGTSGMLKERGIDVNRFWQEVRELYLDGWDPIPAYLYKLVQESEQNKTVGAITKSSLQTWGSSIEFYPGVQSLFSRIREMVSSKFPEVGIEFYLVSSGISEVLKATSIASEFKNIWASSFQYSENGNIMFPKNLVSFTDKTRYIFQIAKGIVGPDAYHTPFAVNQSVKESELYIPFSQIIFVGDGYTDIPCFSLVRSKGGIAFGVYDPNNKSKWSQAWEYVADNRVSNLVPADFSEQSAMMHNLEMAIYKIATNISLSQKSYQG